MATEAVPLTDPSVSVIVINSNVNHKLSDSEYPKRRKRCEECAKILGVKSLRDVSLSLLECMNCCVLQIYTVFCFMSTYLFILHNLFICLVIVESRPV